MATCEHPDIDATSFDDRLSSISDAAETKLHMEIANAVCDDYVPSDSLDDTSDVLKVFLQRLYGPGLNSLAVEIFLYTISPDKLQALRNHLIDALLNPMLARGHKTRVIAPPVQEENKNDIANQLHEIDVMKRDDKLRRACLQRDRGRCVVTQVWSRSFKKRPEGSKQGATKCAHCIPFSLSTSDGSFTQVNNVATTWNAYHRYFPDLKGTIAADSIDQLPNAITLMNLLHAEFRRLELAFEPSEIQDKYTLHWLGEGKNFYLKDTVPSEVQFTTDGTAKDLPNASFLRCHYTLARVYDDLKSQKISLRLLRTLPPPEPVAQTETLMFVGGAVDGHTKKRKRGSDLDDQ